MTEVSDLLLQDRSLRYQYFLKNTEKITENLVDTLAHRKKQAVWVSNKSHSLTEIIAAVRKLNRLPMLVIFDSWSTDNCLSHLEDFSKSLENNGISDGVGIYFRLENDARSEERRVGKECRL